MFNQNLNFESRLGQRLERRVCVVMIFYFPWKTSASERSLFLPAKKCEEDRGAASDDGC